MIETFFDALQVQQIKLPDLIWLCISAPDNELRLATDEASAQKWAADGPGRYVCSVAVPGDTTIYAVEKVPATTRLKQVKP